MLLYEGVGNSTHDCHNGEDNQVDESMVMSKKERIGIDTVSSRHTLGGSSDVQPCCVYWVYLPN